MGNYLGSNINTKSVDIIDNQKYEEEISTLLENDVKLMKLFIEKISRIRYIGQSEKTNLYDYNAVLDMRLTQGYYLTLIYHDDENYYLFVCRRENNNFHKVIIRIKKSELNYKTDEPIKKLCENSSHNLYRISQVNLNNHKIALELNFSDSRLEIPYEKYDFNEYTIYKDFPEEYDFENESFNKNLKMFLNQNNN